MNPNLPSPSEQLEARLIAAARAFPYPPTPNLVASARRPAAMPHRERRAQLGWALAVVLVIVLGALAVPQVRAAIVEFIQIGVVRIFLAPPTPTPTPQPAAIIGTPAPTATPRPTPTFLPSALSFAGETTLEQARARFPYALRLPAYPEDLGEPERVFVQDQGNLVAILVWLEEGSEANVRLALFAYGPDSWGVEKIQPTIEAAPTVNGQPAIWASGPYTIRLRNGDVTERRLIDGHVLIWRDGEITYRLETGLSVEEAVRVAESLR